MVVLTRPSFHAVCVRGVTIFLATLAVLQFSCIRIRPVYSDKEQAIAEKAVVGFHDLHNQKRFDEIYNLLDEGPRANTPMSEILETMQQTFGNVGRVESSTLRTASVIPNPIPGYSSQVSLSYDTKFERGERIENFIWNIKQGEPRLFEYRIVLSHTDN